MNKMFDAWQGGAVPTQKPLICSDNPGIEVN